MFCPTWQPPERGSLPLLLHKLVFPEPCLASFPLSSSFLCLDSGGEAALLGAVVAAAPQVAMAGNSGYALLQLGWATPGLKDMLWDACSFAVVHAESRFSCFGLFLGKHISAGQCQGTHSRNVWLA